MKTSILLLLLLICGAAASAGTCGGFSMVPSQDIVVHYNAALPSGAAHSVPVVSVNGFAIAVSRNVSGGSSIDSTCIDDSIDLGLLGAGRYTVVWTDNNGFSQQRGDFTFAVAGVFNGSTFGTTLLPPATPDKPVRLEAMGCSATPVAAYVAGHEIRLVQHGNDSSLCRLYVVDLGVLPAGSYNVMMFREPADPVADTPFSFIVQQPPPSSSCGAGTSVTATPGGTMHLHYEESFSGYAPTFGPPTVSKIDCVTPEFGCAITVTQTVADIADRTAPGAAPAQSFCHAEDLDLGFLNSSLYDLTWGDVVSVFGGKVDEQDRFAVRFIPNRGQPCTTASTLQLPSAIVTGEPFQVAWSRAEVGFAIDPGSLNVAVAGNVISVNEQVTAHSGPLPEFFAACYRRTATIDALPPGQYTLNWTVSAGNAASTTSTPLTVTDPAHRRAARH